MVGTKKKLNYNDTLDHKEKWQRRRDRGRKILDRLDLDGRSRSRSRAGGYQTDSRSVISARSARTTRSVRSVRSARSARGRSLELKKTQSHHGNDSYHNIIDGVRNKLRIRSISRSRSRARSVISKKSRSPDRSKIDRIRDKLRGRSKSPGYAQSLIDTTRFEIKDDARSTFSASNPRLRARRTAIRRNSRSPVPEKAFSTFGKPSAMGHKPKYTSRPREI